MSQWATALVYVHYVQYLSEYTHTVQHVHTSTSDFWPHHIQSLYRAQVFKSTSGSQKNPKPLVHNLFQTVLKFCWKTISISFHTILRSYVFLRATVLVGFVGSTFLVRDSYKPLFVALTGKRVPYRKKKIHSGRTIHIEDSTEGRCFHRYFDISRSCWNREGRDLPRWSGGVGVACFWKALEKGRAFREKCWKVLFCDVGLCHSILMFSMSILGDQKNRKQVQTILYIYICVYLCIYIYTRIYYINVYIYILSI